MIDQLGLEAMSDFDINCLIVDSLGIIQDVYIKNKITRHSVDGSELHQAHDLDYCNNPSDAYPIIFENKIDTGWAFDDVWDADISNQGQPGEFKRFKSYSKNPLRAAMIVYLLMQEAKND